MRVQIPEALKARRDARAERELAKYDFGEFVTVDQVSGHWNYDEPERWYTVVWGSFDSGETLKCQFNVWFQPGSAVVADVYEGDWH